LFIDLYVSSYNMNMFEPHGNYIVEANGNILYVEAYGPWNLESAVDFEQMVKSEVTNKLSKSYWAMVALIHGQGLYTPDAMPVINALHLWRIENGLRHIAIVLSKDPASGSTITEHQFNTIYKQTTNGECISRYFYTKEEAYNWLETEGYSTS
ncbi:MAG: hypothetical protein JXR64_04225, partial [Spirochaetales bacterium]|nr:hypothetical protein [Spirochaetales bacterium]